MSTEQKAMDLAETYARANAAFHLEHLYGTSKAYIKEKKKDVFEARAELFAELRRLQAENEAMRAQVEALTKPQEPVQWQKRHQEQTEGLWESTTHHDAKWWEGNSTGWEIRALYTHPAPAPTRPAVPEDFLESPDIADEDSLLNTYYSRELVLECIAAALEAAMLAAAPQAEHVTDGNKCWCNPAIITEENGDVIVHNQTDNWQQYATPGETAQACIERHRSEQDALMNLLKEQRAAPQDEAQKGGV